MPEPIEAGQIIKDADTRWSDYNAKMAELFVERDKHPVDSAEREVAAQAILNLWADDGYLCADVAEPDPAYRRQHHCSVPKTV